MIHSGSIFYGIRLDVNDPYFERNLARLEKRFLGRYNASQQKDQKRREEGRPIHPTMMLSIKDNKDRLETVQLMRQLLKAHKNAQSQSEPLS